jgi:hypothetical protein
MSASKASNTATDFLAAVIEHVPPKSQHLIRYYGLLPKPTAFYSNVKELSIVLRHDHLGAVNHI